MPQAAGIVPVLGEQINLSRVFAGQDVGVKQVSDRIWLVTFMDYDLGYFDDETCRLEPIGNPCLCCAARRLPRRRDSIIAGALSRRALSK